MIPDFWEHFNKVATWVTVWGGVAGVLFAMNPYLPDLVDAADAGGAKIFRYMSQAEQRLFGHAFLSMRSFLICCVISSLIFGVVCYLLYLEEDNAILSVWVAIAATCTVATILLDYNRSLSPA